ncbi:MAG: alpha/beta fold hydrolase [Thermoleophilaceae bacterium]
MTIRFTTLLAVLASAALAACGGDDNNSASNAPPADTTAQEAGSTTGEGGAKKVTVKGQEALVWGKGDYGVVLAHGAAFDAASWQKQATRIAGQGMVAIAVEDLAPDSILAAADYLKQKGTKDVAFVGGSAGADAILETATQEPNTPDQLILLSANQTVDGLGSEPKLFIASEKEPRVDISRELSKSAPGDQNEAKILPGDAHAQNIFDTDQGPVATKALLERLQRFSRD